MGRCRHIADKEEITDNCAFTDVQFTINVEKLCQLPVLPNKYDYH